MPTAAVPTRHRHRWVFIIAGLVLVLGGVVGIILAGVEAMRLLPHDDDVGCLIVRECTQEQLDAHVDRWTWIARGSLLLSVVGVVLHVVGLPLRVSESIAPKGFISSRLLTGVLASLVFAPMSFIAIMRAQQGSMFWLSAAVAGSCAGLAWTLAQTAGYRTARPRVTMVVGYAGATASILVGAWLMINGALLPMVAQVGVELNPVIFTVVYSLVVAAVLLPVTLTMALLSRPWRIESDPTETVTLPAHLLDAGGPPTLAASPAAPAPVRESAPTQTAVVRDEATDDGRERPLSVAEMRRRGPEETQVPVIEEREAERPRPSWRPTRDDDADTEIRGAIPAVRHERDRGAVPEPTGQWRPSEPVARENPFGTRRTDAGEPRREPWRPSAREYEASPSEAPSDDGGRRANVAPDRPTPWRDEDRPAAARRSATEPWQPRPSRPEENPEGWRQRVQPEPEPEQWRQRPQVEPEPESWRQRPQSEPEPELWRQRPQPDDEPPAPRRGRRALPPRDE